MEKRDELKLTLKFPVWINSDTNTRSTNITKATLSGEVTY